MYNLEENEETEDTEELNQENQNDVNENQEIYDMDYFESDLMEAANDANSIYFHNPIIKANQSQMNINDPDFNIENFKLIHMMVTVYLKSIWDLMNCHVTILQTIN